MDWLTEDEVSTTRQWIAAGFKRYAEVCGALGGQIRNNIRQQVLAYGTSFDGLLAGIIDVPDDYDVETLKRLLFELKTADCPAAVLVELTLLCSSAYKVTIVDLLWRAEMLDDGLKPRERLGFADPANKRGKGISRRAVGATRTEIPWDIEAMQKTGYATLSSEHFAYFYLFLDAFKKGHDALSYLLTATRIVREIVPAVSTYLVFPGAAAERDGLSPGALQRKVLRYFDENPSQRASMESSIRALLADPASHRSVFGDPETFFG